MTVHIALLRGINLGGARRVAMADLREMVSELGFEEPRTLLQSGNLLFGTNGRTCAALERLLETEIARRLDLRTDFIVRTADEWARIIAANPFAREAARDPSHTVAVCLKAAPDPKDVRELQAAIAGPERLDAAGKELYIVYPAGIGKSKLTAAVIDRKLKTRGTARNWNTVLKLARLAGV